VKRVVLDFAFHLGGNVGDSITPKQGLWVEVGFIFLRWWLIKVNGLVHL